MELARGEYFFHYTTRDAALGKIIPFGQLKLSSLRQMRDPLENQLPLMPAASGVGPTTSAEDLKRHHALYVGFSYLLNQVRERARLLALTVDADDYSEDGEDFARGYARPRMWEHYAEEHRGVCLAFRREDLCAALRNSAAELLVGPLEEMEVEYTETGAIGLTLELDSLKRPPDGDCVADFIARHRSELYFRKALDWKTEYEHRFLATVPELWKDDLYLDFGDSLKALIAGEEFPPWQRAAAHDVCRKNEVALSRLDWTLGRPTLEELPEGIPNRSESGTLFEALKGISAEASDEPSE